MINTKEKREQFIKLMHYAFDTTSAKERDRVLGEIAELLLPNPPYKRPGQSPYDLGIRGGYGC